MRLPGAGESLAWCVQPPLAALSVPVISGQSLFVQVPDS